MLDEMGPLAYRIYKAKYSMDGREEWPDTAERVVSNVMGPYMPGLVGDVTQLVTERKFMPGGRYLYAAGRPMHQVNNCVLTRVEDSREGWASWMRRLTQGLMTGAGFGTVFSDLRGKGELVRGMGGLSTGPLALMQMGNEAGRHIMQGGSRRSAMWAGLHWNHPDALEFIDLKNWSEDVTRLKDQDFNFPATMDTTNISVILDDAFFDSYWNGDPVAHNVYDRVIHQMLKTGEPGFSIDVGENAGENLRNAPVTGGTRVLTSTGYLPVSDLVNKPYQIWTGKQWANGVIFKKTMDNAPIVRVEMTGGRQIRCEPNHEFLVRNYKGLGERRTLVSVERVAASKLLPGTDLEVSLPESQEMNFDAQAYTLGYGFGDGSFRDGRMEITFCTNESIKCAQFVTGYDAANWKDGRGYVRMYWHRGFDNYQKDQVPWMPRKQIPSFIAGLFDADGNWETSQNRIRLASKHRSFLDGVARMLESIGILSHVSKAGISTYGKSHTYQLVVASSYSIEFARLIPTVRVAPDLTGYESYRKSEVKVISVTEDGVEDVYCADVKVEEHSFMAEGVIISNCTEITSRDDNDVCNLGSINLSRIGSIGEMEEANELATAFLLCGTLYSDLPYDEVGVTREKNRRLGLGLMGVYDWLVTRGKGYQEDVELGQWLDVYAQSTDIAAGYADELSISRPVKTRAMAPNGTISMVAETTSSIEPLFAHATKRRFLDGPKTWKYQYTIDATTERLVEKGINPDTLPTAYELAKTPEKRIAFQAWFQQWVDHGISSTLNLPEFEKQEFTPQEFGGMLIKYLPKLRGVTAYPNGSRAGQPLNAVPYSEAISQTGVDFEETSNEKACISGTCGI